MLIFWVGSLASKLAAAVSECEDTLSVGGGLYGLLPGNDRGPLCASGVGQLAGALGELAGASSMVATSCGNITRDDGYDYEHHRNHFFDGHVSTFGDQTQEYIEWRNLWDERKLLIGEGYVGNDSMCSGRGLGRHKHRKHGPCNQLRSETGKLSEQDPAKARSSVHR